MDILNNIWTFLITENEGSSDVYVFWFAIIEMYILILLTMHLFNIKYSKKQLLTYVLLTSFTAYISDVFVSQPYSSIINAFLIPFFIKIIFKISVLKSIICHVFQYITLVIIGMFSFCIYIYSFNISIETATNTPLYRISSSLISYFLIYALYLFCRNKSINISLLEKMNKKNNRIIVTNFFIGILSIAIEVYFFYLYSDVFSIYTTLLAVGILFVYFSFNMFSLVRTNKLEETSLNLEQEKEYNKSLTFLYDNIRVFRHEFNNIVNTLGGYIAVNDMDGLKTYYANLSEDCQKTNNLTILSPKIITNPAVYSLLSSKYYSAEEKGIKLNLDIFLDLNTLMIKIYDFTRILGILLDNAIDASSQCEEKIINVVFRVEPKKSRQIIIIENTYLNKDIDTEKIFEKGYSSKQDEDKSKHGLGLWEIKQILRKNKNLNLYTSKSNEFFKQQLEIY